MAINIKGEIGWDVFAHDVQRQLNYANGDIEIVIDSPGGSVFEGISIADAIRNYKKGNITVKVIFAASMATYISMFGHRLVFNTDSSFMIHNPSAIAWGDYREMENRHSLLFKLTDMFRKQYSSFTGKSYEDIKDAMDAETWYIGKDDLMIWGEVVESDKDATLDPEIIKACASEKITKLNAKMTNDYVKADLEKVAKMLVLPNSINMSGSNISSTRLEKQEEKMDLNELKSKYPDVYNQAKKEGYQDGFKVGVDCERKRVQDHMQFADIDSAKDLVVDAIKEGTPFADMFAKYTRLSLNTQEINNMQSNSPKDVNPNEANQLQTGGTTVQDKANTDEIEKGLSALGLWEVK